MVPLTRMYVVVAQDGGLPFQFDPAVMHPAAIPLSSQYLHSLAFPHSSFLPAYSTSFVPGPSGLFLSQNGKHDSIRNLF